MSLRTLRRRSAPITLVVYASFACSLFSARSARAAEADEPAPAPPPTAEGSSVTPMVERQAPAQQGAPLGHGLHAEPPAKLEYKSDEHDRLEAALSTPGGGSGTGTWGHGAGQPSGGSATDKSGVSAQAMSVPQGAGKIEGLGESFSVDPSTGVAVSSIPFSLPHARGGSQPSLALSYNSGGAHGVAGVGWSAGVPYIARQTDRGLPSYADPAVGGDWTPSQDRFVFNGGQELVPICRVVGTTCAGALPGEVMPAWAGTWQYFRARVEGSFLRFFWSPDHRTWRVQSKGGEQMELGVPLDGSNDTEALDVDPARPARIFRWSLSRQYDAEGAIDTAAPAPVNVTVFRYFTDQGTSYLSDVYDTPPAAGSATSPLAQWEHHVHLRYEARPDPISSFRRGWLTTMALRLTGADVTSKSFAGGAAGARELLRRYHLAYDAASHVSLLVRVQMEGRCASPIAEGSTGLLPDATSCPKLPATTLGYTHVTGPGGPIASDLAGYEGFDETVHSLGTKSPPYSIDGNQADLFDANADGLPDLVVTLPAQFHGAHGLYCNGAGGVADSFTAGTIGVSGVLGEDTSIIKLANPNLTALDLDGDGVGDLVHMPQVKQYSVYSPQVAGGCTGTWVGRAIATASAQSAKIDFTHERPDTRVVDVNGDGLVDVVFTAGNETQTFFALGRYPGGDGQFGHASWTSATTAAISNDPVETCALWSGSAVRFSDPDVKLADMNGDGLTDVVRLRRGDLRYWPGRGNGEWGTGPLGSCVRGAFAQDTDVAMASSPQFAAPDATTLRLDDVNGDGLPDLVEVGFDALAIWLKVDGASWTGRHVLRGAPVSSIADHVRLVDVNGSGTRDLLWGDGGNYRYVDLLGGQRPWLLVHSANGLGQTTDLQYATSTQLMLAAEAAGQAWTSKTPMPVTVVTKMTVSDDLPLRGRPAGSYVTSYDYANPVYDGRQREFRGFRTVGATHVGDANSPTSTVRTTYLLGECVNEPTVAGADVCAPAGRWADNPREALKGVSALVETVDAHGVYLSTEHQTTRLRTLYHGLDGRLVRQAFASATDSFRYDVAAFDAIGASFAVADVEREPVVGTVAPEAAVSVPLRATKGRAHLRKTTTLDAFGNASQTADAGCVQVDAVACPTTDEPLATFTTWNRRADDASGWRWRAVQSHVEGISGALWHQTFTQYDLAGKPTQTSAQLLGTLALDRFHEDSTQKTAPAPTAQSVDGTIVLSTISYDKFGNATDQKGANGRCAHGDFDPDFSDLQVRTTTYTGTVGPSGCGTVAVSSTTTTYDRGLGAALVATGPHDEVSQAAYDGFGRVTSLWKPDPTTGRVSSQPSTVVEYWVPADGPSSPAPALPAGTAYSLTHVKVQDGKTPDVASWEESWTYSDGMGRAVASLTQADTTAGDKQPWIASGLTDYDAKGAVARVYNADAYGGAPSAFPLARVPTAPSSRKEYDAFSRPIHVYGVDNVMTLQSAYHALSSDASDAEDLSATSKHAGTFATTRQDGHGRLVSSIERVHATPTTIELRETRTAYTPTGQPTTITRVRVGAADAPVVRWMKYDSLGRLVLNVDPDATKGFNPDPGIDPSTMKTWRYAYDDAGDVVGTSDARGCGVNYAYDAGGRLVTEDYSPCQRVHPAYSPVTPATGAGAEVFYQYDSAAGWTIPGFAIDPSTTLGLLVAVSDRGAQTVTRYDRRGRPTGTARRLARPADVTTGTPYAPRWYTRAIGYDGADRAIADVTQAADSATAMETTSSVTTAYSKRGTVKRVDSDHGLLINAVTRDPDGQITQIQYGDGAPFNATTATTTAFTYDARRRLASVQAFRSPPSAWTSPPGTYFPAPTYSSTTPSSFQLTLQYLGYQYDLADNPTSITDYRVAGEWPAGAKPVNRTIAYDDLYRVARVDYAYSSGDDPWVSPFRSEDSGATDSKRAKPSPRVSFDRRTRWQTFAYDWLGNNVDTEDDARGFADRSIGVITNGAAGAGPYQLKGASNVSANPGSPSREGRLSAAYDDAGNMTSMATLRTGPCLPTNAICSQRYAYEWDEVGRLSRARRWDLASPGAATDPVPATTAAAELRYAYDGEDTRVLKTAVDSSGVRSHTAYPLETLELRRASWSSANEYTRDPTTQVAYLFGHGVRLARVETVAENDPSLTSGKTHTFLELPDHLGSTQIVIDHDTGELVEYGTYQVYGATESDYRPDRWNGLREDYRFTGKEEDVEIGLQYFGKRYYAPSLGRWVSADPEAIHALGADPNVYAYVRGRVFVSIDPNGLDGITLQYLVHDLMQGDNLSKFVGAQIDKLGAQIDKAETRLNPFLLGSNAVMAARGPLRGGCEIAPDTCRAVWAGGTRALQGEPNVPFLKFYMNNKDPNAVMVMSKDQFQSFAKGADVTNTPEFHDLRVAAHDAIAAGGGQPVTYDFNAKQQMSGNGLGTFTGTWQGQVTFSTNENGKMTAAFEGTLSLHDYWDFDPKDSPRLSESGGPWPEVATRIGTAAPGTPMNVESGKYEVSQQLGGALQIGDQVAPPETPGSSGDSAGGSQSESE